MLMMIDYATTYFRTASFLPVLFQLMCTKKHFIMALLQYFLTQLIQKLCQQSQSRSLRTTGTYCITPTTGLPVALPVCHWRQRFKYFTGTKMSPKTDLSPHRNSNSCWQLTLPLCPPHLFLPLLTILLFHVQEGIPSPASSLHPAVA